jgi:L-fuconolactonase
VRVYERDSSQSRKTLFMRIDAHHHLWQYDPTEYDWIDERMTALRRDFLPSDMAVEAAAADVDATVAVQARQTLAETDWLLDLAEDSTLIRGVVGWAPIAHVGFPDMVDELAGRPLLKGLRHVVQAEPAGFLDDAAFHRGISAMLGSGLVYDVLIFARQLEEATRFIDRHPDQIFVLDHIAKPDICHDGFASWAKDLRELARRPNVFCKLSGMVTEAPWDAWTPSMLHPYFETALTCFGAARLMAGSDWPVCKVAATYLQWWETLAGWLNPLSPDERVQIEGRVAKEVYRIR